MSTKRKISVTVQASLLREVDRAAGPLSRSAVFEQALSSWLRHQRQARLDQAIEDYYRSLADDERREDAEWATLADETIRQDWTAAEE